MFLMDNNLLLLHLPMQKLIQITIYVLILLYCLNTQYSSLINIIMKFKLIRIIMCIISFTFQPAAIMILILIHIWHVTKIANTRYLQLF